MKPHNTIILLGKSIRAFHFFGVLGFIIGTILGAVLCYFLKLSIATILLMSLTAAITFFILAILAKIITGEETIVYYHHEIAILITCSIVLKILNFPVLVYLDITILGIATFLAFGRIGCFNVGCCHGKPFKKGVVYGHKHVQSGFTRYYEDIPLFPVQLIESAFVFIVVITGTLLLLKKTQPGTVLLVYTVIYGSFRFVVEFFRGDPERPYWKGLSEAQWTTLLLITVSLVLSVTRIFPLYAWHIIVSLLLFILAFLIAVRANIENRIISPRHIQQIAMALNRPADNNKSATVQNDTILVNIFQTDLGINLSEGYVRQQGVLIKHYTISTQKNNLLSYPAARKLATIIKQLQKHKGSFKIQEKTNSLFHILFEI
jgi:prolipoprotein diacylglyceryltransferase